MLAPRTKSAEFHAPQNSDFGGSGTRFICRAMTVCAVVGHSFCRGPCHAHLIVQLFIFGSRWLYFIASNFPELRAFSFLLYTSSWAITELCYAISLSKNYAAA